MNLNILKLIDPEEEKDEKFFRNMDSSLRMYVNRKKIIENEEWIDKIEFTIPYIEKALRNPNKNIITEEEVIKIEQIKKVTVESIKHLSKNTNLISEWDQDSGDVIPSKILNSFKEESFLTYENKFIYTLIKLIEDFVFIRTKDTGKSEYKGKHHKKAVYEASTKSTREKITVNMEYTLESLEENQKEGNVEERIRDLNMKIKTLKATDMYQLIDSKKITLIKAPLKMTNVLLKNVNFQYAVKLWQYLSDNFELKNEAVKEDTDYEAKGITKELVDESFYLNHLIFTNENGQENKKKKLKAAIDQKAKQEMTDTLIEKIITINPELAEQELKKMIAERYVVIKNRNVISLKPIENRFREKIDSYLSKVKELRLK